MACRLLDLGSCQCADYAHRKTKVPDCVILDPATVAELSWMPSTCAYRLIWEGKDLAWWHPLVSGDPETVHLAGISVRNRVVSENPRRRGGPARPHRRLGDVARVGYATA